MPYDPTLPVNNSPIVAAELRNQFAGLMNEIQQRAIYQDVYDAITAQASGPLTGLAPPVFTVSNPPTQAEVQALADFVTAMYVAASRT
jgi:hypothetical protein